MTYTVEGQLVIGAIRVSVVNKTEVTGTRIRGIDLFSGSKKPVWVVIQSGSELQTLDIKGASVDPAKIDALLPGGLPADLG